MATRANAIRGLALYKLGKSALQWLGALVLSGVLVARGPRAFDWIPNAERALREHTAPQWSEQLAQSVLSVFTVHHAWIAVGALFADGLLGLLEGAALWRGAIWGEWLVVVTTGTPLPFELYESLREPHAGRLITMLLNVLLLLYLLGRRVRPSRS